MCASYIRLLPRLLCRAGRTSIDQYPFFGYSINLVYVADRGRGVIHALRNVGGGLAASLLSLAYCFSYGAIIFSGPLEPFLSQGVASALITAAVTATFIALTSGFKFAIAGPDSNTTALLAAMTVILAPTIAVMPQEQALVLALAALASAALLTGL